MFLLMVNLVRFDRAKGGYWLRVPPEDINHIICLLFYSFMLKSRSHMLTGVIRQAFTVCYHGGDRIVIWAGLKSKVKCIRLGLLYLYSCLT